MSDVNEITVEGGIEGQAHARRIEKQLKWDRHFLQLALQHARMSKDPRTKVGSVIVGPDLEFLSAGFNGLPRGIEDTPGRLNDKEMKLWLIVHAEMNAVLAAARNGVALKGSTMYVACTDEAGRVYGGPPCVRCTVEVIQAGVREVVYYPYKEGSSWKSDLVYAAKLLEEAKIYHRMVEPEPAPSVRELITVEDHINEMRIMAEDLFHNGKTTIEEDEALETLLSKIQEKHRG